MDIVGRPGPHPGGGGWGGWGEQDESTRVRSNWDVMHSEAGWVEEEPALRAIELPVGFYPIAVEIPKAVQAGPGQTARDTPPREPLLRCRRP